MFYWFVKGVFYPFVTLYLGLTRDGLEHLPERGQAIVVSNHVSYMDAILLGSASPRPIHFIVLQWMYDLIAIRWFYWGMGTIPVRAGSDARGIRRALRTLASGGVVGVFPEGTRSADGRVREAQPGAALLAALSGAPVVPAFIDGARDSMPVGTRFPRPARIHVRFGPPLRFPADRGARDRDALLDFAQRMEAEIRALEPVVSAA
jgi:1-acyl-sn-glycerol-3-phosphate acyltransferase